MSDGTAWRSLNAPFDEDGFALVKRDIETLFLKSFPYVQDSSSSPSFSFSTAPLPESSLGIPGVNGINGTGTTIAIGTTTTGAPGTMAAVTNTGDTTNAVFNFTIPTGAASTVLVGGTTTGDPGTSASVTNGGSGSTVILNFTIPQGATGATGPAGANGTNGTNGRDGTIPTGPNGEVMSIIELTACVDGVTKTIYVFGAIKPDPPP